MCFNQGPLDRALRVSAGLGLIAYGLMSGNILLAVVGIVPLVTGAIGFCPFYMPIKLNTGCKKD